jgi:hypothetical protein
LDRQHYFDYFHKNLALGPCRQCKPVRAVCDARTIGGTGDLSRRIEPRWQSDQFGPWHLVRPTTTGQEGAIGKGQSAAQLACRLTHMTHEAVKASHLLKAVAISPLAGKPVPKVQQRLRGWRLHARRLPKMPGVATRIGVPSSKVNRWHNARRWDSVRPW